MKELNFEKELISTLLVTILSDDQKEEKNESGPLSSCKILLTFKSFDKIKIKIDTTY